MQHISFWRPRHTPIRRAGSRRDLGRWWAILCLLPMLWMGVWSQMPHSHELWAMAHLVGAQQSERVALPGQWLASDSNFGAAEGAAAPAASRLSASHLEHGPPNECPLCQWASVAVACLVGMLAICWPHSRVLARFLSRLFRPFEVPLCSRSRAPPFGK